VLPIGQALVVEMGAEPVIISEADRPTYAEAVETATSFSAAIVGQAVGLLASLGIESPGAVIAPLVRSSVETALAAAVTATTIDLSSLSRGDDEEDFS
jgi:predicted short-subunit dehydrogenase-like oxidoreductase (DUF2520 family)